MNHKNIFMNNTTPMIRHNTNHSRRQPSDFSPQMSLKRPIVFAAIADSSIKEASPENCSKPQQETLPQEKQSRDQIDDSRSRSSYRSSLKTSKRNHLRRSRHSHVSFGEVCVRIYDRSIGDWWDIQHGLCLAWQYAQMPAVPLPSLVDDKSKAKKGAKAGKARFKSAATMVVGMLAARKKLDTLKENDTYVNVDETGRRDSTEKKIGRGKRGKTKSQRRRSSYEDCKPSSKFREELLLEFGFSETELKNSEKERKLLRLEYLNWTPTSKHPSKLFVERCLAESPAVQ